MQDNNNEENMGLYTQLITLIFGILNTKTRFMELKNWKRQCLAFKRQRLGI